MKILILNGPNLNLIGKREPEIYGNQSLDEYFEEMRKRFPDCTIDAFQTNHEGVLIDKLHEAMGRYDGVVMNPGGYAHTSIALADAVRAIKIPVVEVHISNIQIPLPRRTCPSRVPRPIQRRNQRFANLCHPQ